MERKTSSTVQQEQLRFAISNVIRPSEKGGRSSRPWDKGGPGLKKNFFSALRASVWSKNKGGRGPPGPSPGSTTDKGCLECEHLLRVLSMCDKILQERAFHSVQNSGNPVRNQAERTSLVRPTGIFRTTFKGGLLSPVRSFRSVQTEMSLSIS